MRFVHMVSRLHGIIHGAEIVGFIRITFERDSQGGIIPGNKCEHFPGNLKHGDVTAKWKILGSSFLGKQTFFKFIVVQA